jgi:phage tail-like protein
MNAPESQPLPARYALARDREQWDGIRAALDADADGNLTLARMPGPANGVAIDLPGPYAPGPSGIAAGPCGVVFLSATAHHRLVIVERRCGTRAWLPASGVAGGAPGQFNTPRGLAIGAGGLAVADSGNARVQMLAFPALEAHAALQMASAGLLQNPTGVAFDSAGREYVLDSSWQRVFRFDASGVPDAAYDTTLKAQNALTQPFFLAIGDGDVLLVSDAASNAVVVFRTDGTVSHQLPPPPGLPWLPGAIACAGPRVFVHDTRSGTIQVFTDSHAWCCALAGWRGPVTALAIDADGDLLIKSGLDDAFVVLKADASFAGSGTIEIGPLDAGEHLEWFRAAVDVDLPSRTRATLEVAQLDPPAPPPTAADWIAAPSLDTMLAPLVPAVPPPSRRWLWLRVTLATSDPRVSPTLRQLRAETPGEDYLDYLPAVYRRTDSEQQLFRLLALARAEQSRVDERVDDMPRVALPSFAATSTLPWLAEWVDFELPSAAGEAERRQLVAEAVARHERRGTPASMRDFVELYTGIRPGIVEGFTRRAVWVLGESSQLGFDTALPASHPDGLVVPDSCTPAGDPPRCGPPPIGSAVVGETGPLPRDRFGEPLFADTAHRFDVIVPAHRASDGALVDAIRRIIEREKPAHTQYCLCVVPPEISVGFQAQIGVDTVVGGSPPAFRLDESRLGLAAMSPDESAGRIGMNASVGLTTLLT